MLTFTGLEDELLQVIAGLLDEWDVVQLRLSCRHLQSVIDTPKTTQLCPGTWRVPQHALPDITELVEEAVERTGFPNMNTILQWSYLLDFTGELQWQLQGTMCCSSQVCCMYAQVCCLSAEWLKVVYVTPALPLDDSDHSDPFPHWQGLRTAAATQETALQLLKELFPQKGMVQPVDCSPLMAYVVSHKTKTQIIIISNMAHLQLHVQLNHECADWQRNYQHIELWPAPFFKMQPIKWTF